MGILQTTINKDILTFSGKKNNEWNFQILEKRMFLFLSFSPALSNSVNSSMNGQQYRMRDDGPQYEKIPDSRNTTPHVSPPLVGPCHVTSVFMLSFVNLCHVIFVPCPY